MENKILKNLNLNLIITLLTSILLFSVNKYFTKYMGIENLGLMKLFTQLVTFLNLAELGIGTASTYALYKPLLEKDIKKVNLIISTLNFFYKRISFFVMIAGGIFSLILPFIIKISLDYKVYVYWYLYVVNVVASYWSAKYSIIFIANQEYSYVRKIEGFSKVLFQSFQIVIIIYLQSFVLYILFLILQNIFTWIMYKKYFIKNYAYIKFVNEIDKSIFKNMTKLFWHKIGGFIVFNTDYIIISKFISLSVVGIYSSYLMIYQIALTLINILTSVLNPIVGNYIANNNNNNIYNYWKKLDSFYYVSAVIFISCIYKLSNSFIILWLGENYILPNITVILILINLFIHIVRNMIGIFKNNYGFFDDIHLPIIESLINLTFSLILVQKLGLNGVILGTLFSNIIVIMFLSPILVFRKCFEKQRKDYIVYIAKKIKISVLAFIINYKILEKFIKVDEIDSWFKFTIKSIQTGAIVTMVTILIFLLDNQFRKNFKFKRQKITI